MNRPIYKPRTNAAALLALLLAITTILANIGGVVYAATLTSASLGLQDPRPSQTNQYTITANGFSTGTAIGCIEVDLGTASDGSGTITGLDTSSSTFVSQSITASGAWTVDNTQSASAKLRAVNATPVAPQTGSQTIVFGAVKNGSTTNTPYYAVIKTYTTNACSTPVDSVTVQFVYTDAQSVTASVDPTLSFAVAGVSSGGTVNGATINATTTGTTIPFGTIVAGTNKIAAQDVTVTTNAGNGYTVYLNYTGQLKSGSNTLADLSGAPNSTPISFPASTEAFGYTTEDTTLGTGTAGRFGSNKWAAFTTTPAEVAYNGAGVSSQTTRIGFQTGIVGTTKAGSYSTTVVYTATPVY